MRTAQFLVIEDNPEDVAWLRVILKKLGLAFHLTIAEDGEQAIDCMLRRGNYNDAPIPDLIFLDMHLPLFDGLDILRLVPGSAELPIWVLTSSIAEESPVRAHFGRAVVYLIKPLSAERLLHCLRGHESFRVFLHDSIA